MSAPQQLITVLDVTYINTKEGGQAQFIGLWYTDGEKCYLTNFGLDRVDILALEEGDRGYLSQKGWTVGLRSERSLRNGAHPRTHD